MKFWVPRNLPFAGLLAIGCGDIYQLPPVKGSLAYSRSTSIKGWLSLDLEQNFKIDMIEVMRHKM